MSKYRKSTPEYRDEVVKLVLEEQRSIADVARELGINDGTLGNWVSKYRRAHPAEETLNVSERARLRELERENRQLRLERNFLKKRPQPSSRRNNRNRPLRVHPRGEGTPGHHDQQGSARAGRDTPARAHVHGVGGVRSGYYQWRDRQASARTRRRELVTAHVRAAFQAGRGTYGARRVHAVTSRSDDPAVASASLKLVRSIMRELGLFACQPRAYRTTTTNDGTGTTIEDHLRRDFTSDTRRQARRDITYIRTW